MFDTLMASAPPRPGLGGRVGSNAVSLTVHGAIIAFAVFATMKPDVVQIFPVSLDSISYVVQPPEEESSPPQPIEVPPHPVFKTIAAPVQVPTGIPPIDSGVTFDPTALENITREGTFDALTESESTDPSQVFTSLVVDEAPIRISSPPLEYPPAMQRAGIEGIVVLQAIVDTTGRIEAQSVTVVESDNPAFEWAAKRLIERSVFRPGRMGGRLVRVLIQLPVQFRLIGRQP